MLSLCTASRHAPSRERKKNAVADERSAFHIAGGALLEVQVEWKGACTLQSPSIFGFWRPNLERLSDRSPQLPRFEKFGHTMGGMAAAAVLKFQRLQEARLHSRPGMRQSERSSTIINPIPRSYRVDTGGRQSLLATRTQRPAVQPGPQ